jgi:hypothetical protein
MKYSLYESPLYFEDIHETSSNDLQLQAKCKGAQRHSTGANLCIEPATKCVT